MRGGSFTYQSRGVVRTYHKFTDSTAPRECSCGVYVTIVHTRTVSSLRECTYREHLRTVSVRTHHVHSVSVRIENVYTRSVRK